MTKDKIIKEINKDIRFQIKEAKRILNNRIDSPGDAIDYGMARGARWALEWVRDMLKKEPIKKTSKQ